MAPRKPKAPAAPVEPEAVEPDAPEEETAPEAEEAPAKSDGKTSVTVTYWGGTREFSKEVHRSVHHA